MAASYTTISEGSLEGGSFRPVKSGGLLATEGEGSPNFMLASDASSAFTPILFYSISSRRYIFQSWSEGLKKRIRRLLLQAPAGLRCKERQHDIAMRNSIQILETPPLSRKYQWFYRLTSVQKSRFGSIVCNLRTTDACSGCDSVCMCVRKKISEAPFGFSILGQNFVFVKASAEDWGARRAGRPVSSPCHRRPGAAAPPRPRRDSCTLLTYSAPRASSQLHPPAPDEPRIRYEAALASADAFAFLRRRRFDRRQRFGFLKCRSSLAVLPRCSLHEKDSRRSILLACNADYVLKYRSISLILKFLWDMGCVFVLPYDVHRLVAASIFPEVSMYQQNCMCPLVQHVHSGTAYVHPGTACSFRYSTYILEKTMVFNKFLMYGFMNIDGSFFYDIHRSFLGGGHRSFMSCFIVIEKAKGNFTGGHYQPYNCIDGPKVQRSTDPLVEGGRPRPGQLWAKNICLYVIVHHLA
ncbi:unnamed protein product [Nesidiocoris tenuis]|uniref:Uncharacterized protein n=1 Tax=Nesidiocoris tenuis TaxID=355587 RepID=A0A6H5GUW1_9HEMI|nr:unnamed protein product [Nesidiocoris tenuis]